MNIVKNYLFPLLLGTLVYTFFLRNTAEADANQSYELYRQGKAVIIDVREQDEVKEGMIKGALWFPLSLMETNRDGEIKKIKETAKDKEIFVYCRSGKRSGKVQGYLKEAGIKSVNLGGYSSLVDEKLPTQPGPQ